jgi:hypothetical protein
MLLGTRLQSASKLPATPKAPIRRGFFMGDEYPFVGASLLAKAPYQSMPRFLKHRFREQARSHRGGVILKIRLLCWFDRVD